MASRLNLGEHQQPRRASDPDIVPIQLDKTPRHRPDRESASTPLCTDSFPFAGVQREELTHLDRAEVSRCRDAACLLPGPNGVPRTGAEHTVRRTRLETRRRQPRLNPPAGRSVETQRVFRRRRGAGGGGRYRRVGARAGRKGRRSRIGSAVAAARG